MKIALINGSPKNKNSNSGHLLHELKAPLENGNNIISEFFFKKPQISIKDMEHLVESNILVFAFPLYVDGIPSHLLECLIQLESFILSRKKKDIIVYSIVNCGFYEGHQSAIAIEMMKNWCTKAEIQWGQGIGVGAGEILNINVPIGYGPKKNLGLAMKKMVDMILNCRSGDDIYINPNFPRILYKLGGEKGWRKAIRANGLKRKDLFLRR